MSFEDREIKFLLKEFGEGVFISKKMYLDDNDIVKTEYVRTAAGKSLKQRNQSFYDRFLK